MHLHNVEPFYGWLSLYNHQSDPRSPFHLVEHSLFYYNRSINQIPAHPLWDTIESESLLIKVLYADYEKGYAIIELFGEWNDLFDNDYKLLSENCLSYFTEEGIFQFILICENVFHAYFETDDYYEAMNEELEDGWISLIRPRQSILEELHQYNLSHYFHWNEALDELKWRKLKPQQLHQLVLKSMQKILP